MQIAITGVTGCLGQPLVEKLINDGFQIRVLVLPDDSLMSSIKNKVHVITGSLDSSEVLDLLTRDCEIVFHLAGKVHSTPRTSFEEHDFYQVNVEGTRSLLRAASINKVKKVLFYSTVGVIGKDADFHGDELSECEPVSVYARSKYLAEQEVINSSKHGGPDSVVLRFPVVYGPQDRGNVAKLIEAIYKRDFFYFGDGRCSRSMISSKNAAEAAFMAAFALKANNEIFCVTDGQDYKLQELVESICQALRTNWRPFHIPISIAELVGKVGDLVEKYAKISFPINSARVMKLSRPLTFSCEKAKQVFGYEPLETLEEGIFREVEWLKKTKDWR